MNLRYYKCGPAVMDGFDQLQIHLPGGSIFGFTGLRGTVEGMRITHADEGTTYELMIDGSFEKVLPNTIYFPPSEARPFTLRFDRKLLESQPAPPSTAQFGPAPEPGTSERQPPASA